MTNKDLNIAVVGFGTVGAGVVDILQQKSQLLTSRFKRNFVLKTVVDCEFDSDRGVDILTAKQEFDWRIPCLDTEIDVIVELVGGTTIAKDITTLALKNGKSVVTANKALLAIHGKELFALADANNCEILFEASVAGGIPIIRPLRENLGGDSISTIHGIFNGTCNYILTEMELSGRSFADILVEAQQLGYAEAEPSLDVDGFDTAHKAVILASLAFGGAYDLKQVKVKGIRQILPTHIELVKQVNLRLKLLANIISSNDGVILTVEPTLVSATSKIGQVDSSFNGVSLTGDYIDELFFYGRGAGRKPTASAIIGDICVLASASASRNLPTIAATTPPALIDSTRCQSDFMIIVDTNKSDEIGKKVTGEVVAEIGELCAILVKGSTEAEIVNELVSFDASDYTYYKVI